MMKFFYFFTMILITSCSTTINDMRVCHINSDEDYLKTDLICEIVIPDGLTLDFLNSKYDIPSIGRDENHLNVGKKLNICPPIVLDE